MEVVLKPVLPSTAQRDSLLLPHQTSHQHISMSQTGFCDSCSAKCSRDFQYMLMKNLSCNSPSSLCAVLRLNVHRDIKSNIQVVSTVRDKQQYSHIRSDILARDSDKSPMLGLMVWVWHLCSYEWYLSHPLRCRFKKNTLCSMPMYHIDNRSMDVWLGMPLSLYLVLMLND